MIEWVIAGRGRGSSSAANRGYYITVACSKTGRKDGGGGRTQLCIRFSPEAAKDLRLLAGDKVLIGLDHVHKQVCLKRTTATSGSYTLSAPKTAIGVLVVQCRSEFPWHCAVVIDKNHAQEINGHLALDCPTIFPGGAA